MSKNDIDLALKKLIVKFVDNIRIGYVVSDRDWQSLQKDLLIIPAWLDRWKMTVNVHKWQQETKYMKCVV